MAFREFLEEAEGNGDHFGRLVERAEEIEGDQAVGSVKVGGGNGIADVGRPKEAAERAEIGRFILLADSKADFWSEGIRRFVGRDSLARRAGAGRRRCRRAA